jgi:glycosyltransferase involved in cell wall biosynthesis
MKVLWLCSWYPNPISPYDGDFIQRHAKAVAAYIPVDVFYISQSGETVNIARDNLIESEEGNMKEKIIFFRFRKTGLRFIDKLNYNIRYFRTYKKIIKNYINDKGMPDIVHVHVPMKAGMIARWMRKKWKAPYIVSEQSSMYSKAATDSFFKKSSWHRHKVKKIFRNADAVTNVSTAVGETLKVLFNLPAVRIIHNTVNTDFFNYKEIAFSKFRFIHVSGLNYQKNVEGILRAIKRLSELRKDFEVVIAGPGETALLKMIGDLQLNSIVFCTGAISYQEVAIEMQKASAFVMFSRHENFPCVMVEALCCGLPVIGTDVGGVPEAIDEDNGMIVPSENEEELQSAMSTMMNEYQKYNREKIAFNAQQKYSYSTIGKQFLDLYNEIIASG